MIGIFQLTSQEQGQCSPDLYLEENQRNLIMMKMIEDIDEKATKLKSQTMQNQKNFIQRKARKCTMIFKWTDYQT